MTLQCLQKNYPQLRPLERFRLIVAASDRHDESDRQLLTQSSGRVELTVSEHSPYALAFQEVSLQMFLELLDECAGYREAQSRAELIRDFIADEDEETATRSRLLSVRCRELAKVKGTLLQTKVAGWKLFCERYTIAPFLLWKTYPGFSRLELALREIANLSAPEFLEWLHEISPSDSPEVTTLTQTPELIARVLEESYQQRVKWWRG